MRPEKYDFPGYSVLQKGTLTGHTVPHKEGMTPLLAFVRNLRIGDDMGKGAKGKNH
jgi:hypothetical protein